LEDTCSSIMSTIPSGKKKLNEVFYLEKIRYVPWYKKVTFKANKKQSGADSKDHTAF
jgi:hypothetical protein